MNKYKIVLKIGSTLVSNGKNLLDNISKQIHDNSNKDISFIIVTSGAISEGLKIMQLTKKPKDLESLQALAAIGQQQLMAMYEKSFGKHNLLTAQVLLTHDDMNDGNRYLNANGAIRKLLELNVIPIINENDVVATEEIKFGDNDTLAAMVSNLIDSDLMIILTDQDGFFTKNPDMHDDATLIKECDINSIDINQYDDNLLSKYGTGGFKTKLKAVKIASSTDTDTIIASGYEDDVITRIINKESVGTIFKSKN